MFHSFKRFLFNDSNLSQYISILRQSKDQKIIRLLRDPSNPSYYNKELQLNGEIQNKGVLSRLLFRKIKVVNPISYYILYWYVLLFIAFLYNYVQFAIVLAYPGAWQGELTTSLTLFFSSLCIIIFFLDMIVQLNTGFLKRGMIIQDRKRVVQNYIRGAFIFDLTYILFAILCLATGNYYLNWVKFIILFKFGRLSQIDDYFMRRFNVKRFKKTIYTILKLVVIIVLLAHAIGVIFYVIDLYIYTNGVYASQYCWLFSSTAYSPIIQLSYGWQYFYSLYWGINTITTISYGDIQGANPTQVAYMLAMFLVGFMVYGYVVNQIIKVILWSKAGSDKLKAQLLTMQIYTDNLKIPKNIKNQIYTHMQYIHKQQKNRNIQLQATMRDKLPQDLRYQLVANAYADLNEKMINIFMTSTSTKFLFNLVQRKYTIDQPVSNQGERALSLNYLNKGKMEFFVEFGNSSYLIYQTETESQFLGHYELFARKRWPFSVISKTGSTVYSIDRDKMFQQINNIEILRERFKEVEYQVIFKQNFKRIYHTCFFCKVSHDWNKCPSKFPLIKNTLNTNYKQNDGIRIIRNKYHTLNDRKKLEVLRPIQNMGNKKLTNIIQKRIAKIRQKINVMNQVLEIDVAFDWKYFDANQNLSKKKEFWNENVMRRLNSFKRKISIQSSETNKIRQQ